MAITEMADISGYSDITEQLIPFGANRDDSMTDEESVCRLEALVTVDERGQMVLPKDLRERLGIGSGDKLAISSCGCAGEVCCLVLMRADRLDGMVRGVLGPVMREVL